MKTVNWPAILSRLLDTTRWGRLASTALAALVGWLTGVFGSVVANGVQLHGLSFVAHTPYTLYSGVVIGIGIWFSQWQFGEATDRYAAPFLRALESTADAYEREAKAGNYAHLKPLAKLMDDVKRRSKGH